MGTGLSSGNPRAAEFRPPTDGAGVLPRRSPRMLVLFSLLGCAGGEPSTALVLTGWEYRWERLSHRIGYLRTELEQDSSLQLGLLGGDWSTGEAASDTPSWAVRYARVTARDVAFREGDVTFVIGPGWTGEDVIRIPAGDLADRPTLVPLLQGFTIDPAVEQAADYPDYNNAYGYTTQGFAFALGEPEWEGEDLLIPVTATVRWSPQDRGDMNAAIPYARTGVHVKVLLAATYDEVQRQTVGGSVEYPEGFTETDQPDQSFPVDLSGPGREGFVGWQRIDLQGNFLGPDRNQGDYLRTMGVGLVPLDDGPNWFRGEAQLTLTNRSIIQLTQWSAGLSGDLVRIAATGAEVEHFLVEGSHPVGLAETDPTLP